jgi:Putative beta-barrel porin 2
LFSSVVRADELGLTPATSLALGAPLGTAPETGMPIGPFLVYPELTLGGVYNDNLYPAATTRQAAFGYRIAPAIAAINDEGLRKTSLYFNAGAEIYPGAGPEVPATDKRAVSIAAGAQQSWTPTPDLSLQADVGYTRQNSLLQAPVFPDTRFAVAPAVLNLTNGAQFSDLVEAQASIEKTLGRGFFVRAGAGVQSITYESGGESGPAPAGGQDDSATLRFGYTLTPTLSGFFEGDFDRQLRSPAAADSDIYRAVAGLSSDLISLFRGELYGGYQRQVSPSGAFAAASAPTYGARIYYYPTPYLTLSASLDQTFAFATGLPATTAAASPDVTEARLEANYAMATYWRATASLAWARATVSTTPASRVTAWVANARLDYNFWRNLDVTLAYQFADLAAQGGGVRGYDQNVATLGLTYKY